MRQQAEQPAESELVARAREGDNEAFEALYRRHTGRVHALCLRMTGNAAQAEDCVQEAFVQAWKKLSTFQGASAFGTWLYRIAVNEVLGVQRRERRRVTHLQVVGEEERSEEMEYARARGAQIYGEVAGYGSTCEAYHRVRLEECGEEPARAMCLALREAGIPPSAIGYINYHGTSTELNDRVETRAVKLAFDGHAYKLAGSSLKSLIGHPQGACGAAGVAATLLAMRDNMLPPTINLDEPDPECDLDYVPKTGRRLDFEYAVANCIAFGSKNSALVLRKV